jgi:DNA-binding transcriptional ArsR family regulator
MSNKHDKEEVKNLLREWSEAAKDVTRAVGSWRRIAMLDILNTLGSQTVGDVLATLENAGWKIPRSEIHRHLKILVDAGLIDQAERRKEYEITSYGSLILDACKRAALKNISRGGSLPSDLTIFSQGDKQPILKLEGLTKPTAVESSIAARIMEEYGCDTPKSITGLVKVILIVAREKGIISDYDVIEFLEEIENAIRLGSIIGR